MALRKGRGGRGKTSRSLPHVVPLVVLGAGLLSAASEGLAQEPGAPPAVLQVTSETRRRYLRVLVEGALPKGSRATATRVRRGEATAAQRPLSAPAEGSLKLELLVTERLLPDDYVLEALGPDGRVVASGPFKVGTDAEKSAARERLRGWLRNQRYRLRNLAATIECHGRYRFAELDQGAAGGRPPADLAESKGRALSDAFKNLEGRIREVRMDFTQYEREVPLTPYPEATAAIRELFDLLSARKKELARLVDEASAGRATAAPVASSAIVAAAKRSAVALEQPPEGPDSDLWAWDPGPIAKPEVVAQNGSLVTSALGYRLSLPEGWSVASVQLSDRDDPLERLHLVGPSSSRAIVRVSDQPDMPSWKELASELGAQALEEFGNQAYQIVGSGDYDEGRGFRVDATIASGERTRRIVLASRGPASGKRLWQLLVDAPFPEWEAVGPGVEALVASWNVDWAQEGKGR